MDIFSFTFSEIDALGVIFIIILFFGIAIIAGYMAKNNGKSFWMGFLVGLFMNISGLIIIAYIGPTKERKFNPDFSRSNKNLAAIEKLSEINKEGQLSDDEFEKLKNKILKR